MNLLDRIKSRLQLLAVLVLFGCAASDEGLEIALDSNTRVDFTELNLNATNLIIDSLRTDNENRLPAGAYTDDLLGSIEASAHIQYRFLSGSEIVDTLNFDSLVFFARVEQFINPGENFDELLVYNITEEIFGEVVYLADFELALSPEPVDTLLLITTEEGKVVKNFLDSFGQYLFDTLSQEDVTVSGFTAGIALAPSATSTGISTINLADSTFFTLYSSDSGGNIYETRFALTQNYFSNVQRDRSSSALSGAQDLDTLDISDEFALINPLFGVSTLIDLAPLASFTQSNPDIIINRAEIHTGINTTSSEPLEAIRYYFFQEKSGIRGDGLIQDPFNTAILTNEAYLSTRRGLLLGVPDSSNTVYNSDITLFIEEFVRSTVEDNDPIAEKLVLTGNSFMNLEETRVDLSNLRLRIYFTFIE